MFNSATFFRISPEFVMPSLSDLEDALAKSPFTHCELTQEKSSGWIAPRGKNSEILAEPAGSGGVILRLCIERRAVPPSAVNDKVEEMVEIYKKQTGTDRVSGKLKKEFKEDAIHELLPRAFSKRSSTMLWIDPAQRLMVVDSASLKGCDAIVTHLVEALSQLAALPGGGSIFTPIQTQTSAAIAMAHWLKNQEAPVDFTVDRQCELKMPDDQKSTVRYSRHTLELDEVSEHIAQGKLPTMLDMTWNSRVSFTLADDGAIKKIKLLDVVLDNHGSNEKADEGFDADVAIMTGELTNLIPALIEALGGELIEHGKLTAVSQ